MARRFILRVNLRDADAPGFFDLRLDVAKLGRKLRGEPCVDRLCRKMDMSRSEVLHHFTPGAYADPASGEVSLNAGYDPGADEGRLEALIWAIVSGEARSMLTNVRSRPSTPWRA